MLVAELIKNVMRYVGRSDAYSGFEGARRANNPTETQQEILNVGKTLLFCYNAIAEEIARHYVPVKASESMHSESGVYAFSGFSNTPSRIMSVTNLSGLKAKWHVAPSGVVCDEKEVTIEYEYLPPIATFDDEFAYPDEQVGAPIFMSGMAAEYFLMCGDVGLSQEWEERYRRDLDAVMRRRPHSRIPPRRWV